MEINKQTLEEFRRDFAQAVKNLEDKYNMTIELKKITYEDNSFKSTLEARKVGLTNAEWNAYCGNYGFKPDDLGRMFLYNRKWFKITGIKIRSKFPILAEREDGESYSFKADAVKEGLMQDSFEKHIENRR